jgi:hypothetical protein
MKTKLLLVVSAIGAIIAGYGSLFGSFGWLGWVLVVINLAMLLATVIALVLDRPVTLAEPVVAHYELSAAEDAQAAVAAKKWSTAQLDELRTVADPVTDKIIGDVLASKTGGKPDYVAAEKILIWLRDWTAQPTDAQPQSLQDFFNAPLTLPAWCDPDKLRLAEKLFETFGMVQVSCVAMSGVPHFFTNGYGAKSFALAKIFNPDVVKNRMTEIIQMVCYIGAKDGFFPAPVKGNGILCVQKLRTIHSVVRLFLRPQWDIPRTGQPICQEDLAFAMLVFSFSVTDGCKKLGLIQNRDEEDAIYTAWKLFGHTVGVQDVLMPGSLEEGRQLMWLIAKRRSAPNDEGRVLTAELIETAQGWLPRMFQNVPAALLRYLAGDAVGDCLSVPKPEIASLGRIGGFLGREITEHAGLLRYLANHISPLLIRSLTYEHRRNDRTRFIIPENLQQAWQLDVNIQ